MTLFSEGLLLRNRCPKGRVGSSPTDPDLSGRWRNRQTHL
jgi:hypothetical protein